MKLSEAMRLGAMMKPQAFGNQHVHVEYPRLPGDVLGLRAYDATCAWAAAVEAHPLKTKPAVDDGNYLILRGSSDDSGSVLVVPDEWHVVLSAKHQCPACIEHLAGFPLIAHLNDRHRWTRQQIADWVEQIECAREQQQAAEISTPVSAW